VSRFGASDLTDQFDRGPITAPSFDNLIDQLALSEHDDATLRAAKVEMTPSPGRALSQRKIEGEHE
jgi:hypothetical protein